MEMCSFVDFMKVAIDVVGIKANKVGGGEVAHSAQLYHGSLRQNLFEREGSFPCPLPDKFIDANCFLRTQTYNPSGLFFARNHLISLSSHSPLQFLLTPWECLNSCGLPSDVISWRMHPFEKTVQGAEWTANRKHKANKSDCGFNACPCLPILDDKEKVSITFRDWWSDKLILSGMKI